MRIGGVFAVVGTIGLGLLALAACDDDDTSGGGINLGTSGGVNLPDGSSGSNGTSSGAADAGTDAPGNEVVVGPIACAPTAVDIAANATLPYRFAKLDGARRMALFGSNVDSTPMTTIYDGTQWLPPTKLADKAQRFDLVADPAGDAFVVYSNSTATKGLRAVLKAGSTSFVEDGVTGLAPLANTNHIVAPLPSGAVMAFNLQGTPSAVNVAQYNVATASWSAPQPIVTINSVNQEVSIGSNGNHAALLVHSVTAGTVGLVFFDGNTWTTTLTPVPGATGALGDPVLGVFSNGDVYVAWSHPKEATIDGGIYGQRYRAATKTFDPLDTLAKNNDRLHSEPTVLVDSRDHVTVAWGETTGGSTGIMGVARNVGAGFVSTELAGSVPVLAADPGGNVYAVSSDVNGVSRVFRSGHDATAWDAGATLPLVVPANNAAFYINLLFDGAGKAQIFGRTADNHVGEVLCQ